MGTRRVRNFAVTACVAFLALAAWGAAPVPPVPDYVPTCPNPQQIAPVQPAGGIAIGARSSVAWNGKEYGMAYVDNSNATLYFRRFFADGTPAAPAVPVGPAIANYSPSLAWTDTNYGLAWTSYVGAYYQVNFALLSPSGALLSGPTRVSFAGGTQTAHSYAVSLATSGAGFAAVWGDTRNFGTTNYDIYATLLNADGTIAGLGAYHDIAVSTAAGAQQTPSLAWSALSQQYVIAFESYQSGAHYEIYGARLNPASGAAASLLVLASAGATSSQDASLASGPSGLGLVWDDTRDANYEIYFQLLDAGGSKVGTALRLTNDPAGSFYPRAIWTGAEFGVFWEDYRTGRYEAWFQRVTSGGSLPGGVLNNVQATFSSGIYYPDAAFARYGYLASFYGYGNEVVAWGCAVDTTPPTCPVNLVAYNVTGTTATIAWVPSVEDVTDIAYYEVYRNSGLIARTSDTFYADSGLSLNTTYNYYVRSVNAAQLVNGSCTSSSSIYVKTNATLLLMVNKSAPNAALSWTDATMNNYNVFRGTSPQVMQQIGSTASLAFSDPNVLTDNVLYFYTVDEPGW